MSYVKISHCSPKIHVLADLMSTGQFALCDCSYEVINISIYLSIYQSQQACWIKLSMHPTFYSWIMASVHAGKVRFCSHLKP